MVYLDGDNNLEKAGIVDFREMATVGSSDEVNIVVQMDRHPDSTLPYYTNDYGGWTDTRRFLIRKDDDPGVSPVENLGEQNMGHPSVLQSFVEWAVADYPAEHYALVIWNHGDGWRGEADTVAVKAISSDDTDMDTLYMKEVQTALETAKDNLAKRFNTEISLDIVGFDACLMGMVEVAYAIRNVANYMVASEYLEPGNGWPYHTILRALKENPSMSPVDLTSIIVEEYMSFYHIVGRGITQSAFDMTKLDNLIRKINEFTDNAKTEWSHLKIARHDTREFHPSGLPNCWGVDLWDYADKVYEQTTSVEIKASASDLKSAIDEFVIAEKHSADMLGSHGVAIYFPPNEMCFDRDPDHTGYLEENKSYPVDFVNDHTWDNWLQEFYSKFR
jgi:hypothetical protein